jgi:hypothetical protein
MLATVDVAGTEAFTAATDAAMDIDVVCLRKWPHSPALWFNQMECMFLLRHMDDEGLK